MLLARCSGRSLIYRQSSGTSDHVSRTETFFRNYIPRRGREIVLFGKRPGDAYSARVHTSRLEFDLPRDNTFPRDDGVGTPRAVTFASPRIMKGTDTSALRSSTSRSIRILTFKFRRVVDTDPERHATENLPQKMKQEICLYTRTVHFLRLSFGPRYSQY